MFAGFNIITKNQERFRGYHASGLQIYKKYERAISRNLSHYINPDGSLDQELIEMEWFPEIDAHVFLSHSHSDLDFVISFAGWLYEEFGIKAFIDSTVWGSADGLLKQIDEKYCVSSQYDDGSTETYSYQLRNKSTSNIHMILYTALMKMNDNTECLMFINTPSSLKWSDMISTKQATASPWIYGEILASKLIRFKPLSEHRAYLMDSVMEQFDESTDDLSFEYTLDLKHLRELDDDDLEYFEDHFRGTDPLNALNALYRWQK